VRNYWFIRSAIFLVMGFMLVVPLLFRARFSSYSGGYRDYLLFDSIRFYLIVLVVILGVYRLFKLGGFIKTRSKFYLGLSLLFSCLCFISKHSIVFWCFYELAMLPLLYLIFCDSPYSERFIAGWYFLVYLSVTRLPLVLLIFIISYYNSRFIIRDWSGACCPHWVYLVLSFVFFTKVPLIPFHTWLPIVHAESTRIVSIFLSGYIMKLGVLGVYRCSRFIFKDGLIIYLCVCLLFRVCFLITASMELDGKRWLAFLRLSHILVPFIAFFVCDWGKIGLSFLFCLGHGLSAGLVFGALWCLYDIRKSRNWLILKDGLGGKSSTLLFVLGLLSLCSFPPTIQFFCEVLLLRVSLQYSRISIFWALYLFFGGLIPLVLCGYLLVRVERVDNCSWASRGFIYLLAYMVFWCYFGVFII